jgi:hypothetical protein
MYSCITHILIFILRSLGGSTLTDLIKTHIWLEITKTVQLRSHARDKLLFSQFIET